MSTNRISDSTLAKITEQYFTVDSQVDGNNIHYVFRPGGVNIIVNGDKPKDIQIASEFMDELTEMWSEYRGKAV